VHQQAQASGEQAAPGPDAAGEGPSSDDDDVVEGEIVDEGPTG
jgi:hypothetical protein